MRKAFGLRRLVRGATWTLALGMGLGAGVAIVGSAGAKGPSGSVTYLKGSAERAAQGGKQWSAVNESSPLFEGDRVRTGEASRLEIKLGDGSLLRLGASSEVALEQAKIRSGGKKKVQARLFLGRLWAAVTKLVGSESRFEVTTANAVAGVRGTRFAAEHLATGATSVKVYSGKVLVSNKPIYAVEGHTKANRVQVAGPQEVSKKQWEELVTQAMQVVSIAANGTMTQEKFALADPAADDWEAWNSERDKMAGLGE